MDNTVKERLIHFIEYIGLSKNNFEQACSLSTRYVSNISVSIPPDKLKRISTEFPELNISWLLTGEGNMLNGPYERIRQILERESTTEEAFAKKVTTILSPFGRFMYGQAKKRPGDTKTLKQWIKPLLELYPQYSEEWIITGEGDMLKSNRTVVKDLSKDSGAPYYAVDFLAASVSDFDRKKSTPDGYISFPHIREAQAWVNISGKSMSPLIDSGDIIALKRVDDWQTNILYGEVYALITGQYRTVKRIRRSGRDGWIRLVPENPDYDPQEIPVSSITAVFQVLGCAKKIF